MPRTKLKRRAGSLPEPAPPRAPVFWEIRVLPFIERRSLALALCLISVAAVRVAATYSALSVTVDEPGHFACGLQYLAEHTYRYEPQHPPLARAMMALGPYLDGARPAGEPERGKEGMVLLARSGNPGRMVVLMRLGILPFFLLACLVVYYWARHHLGNAVAVIATGLFTMLPPVLADAGLATTDMALAACLGAAFFSLVLWAESPTWRRSLLLGVTCALAALSKFTALGFLPAATMLALLFYLAVKRPGLNRLAALAKERAAMFGLAVFTGALVVWAVYLFSFGKIPGWNLSLPAPEFFDGISAAIQHEKNGHAAYLLGRLSHDGWWYYFPIALAVKTPIGFLLLLVLGVCLCWKHRAKSAHLPLAFSLGILLPSMAGRVDIGLRHILPIYIGLSILAALALVQLAQWARTAARTLILAGLPVVWIAVPGVMQHPDYLAYFNSFAGSEPEKVLVDSNLDWGQEYERLGKRLRALGVHEVSLSLLNATWQYDYLQAWYDLPRFKTIDPYRHPTPGWYVVSATIDKTAPMNSWWDQIMPTERVGGLLLYEISPSFSLPSWKGEEQLLRSLH